MLKRTLLIALLPLPLPLAAATLEIYTDRSFYHYQPSSHFIGFANLLSAKDPLGSLDLENRDNCPAQSPLCQIHQQLETLRQQHAAVLREQQIIQNLIDHQNTRTPLDAETAISTAQKVAARLTELQQKQEQVAKEIQRLEQTWVQKADHDQPVHFQTLPTKEVTLTLPMGLSYDSEYLLDTAQAKLTQFILLKNRSGIDLQATTARLYARPASRIAPPTLFTPWKIRVPDPNEKTKAYAAPTSMLVGAVAESKVEGDKRPALRQAKRQRMAIHKDKSRTYEIKDLDLPSDGQMHRTQVDQEALQLQTALTWHPYNDNRVYETLSFTPKAPIEANSLQIHHLGQTIEHAPFRRDEGRILVNIATDYDLEVSRKAIPEFAEAKGFFGSDRMRKEGFKLDLVNRSDQVKTLKIIERIPLATDEKIRVTLLSFTGDAEHQHDKKTGRLEIRVKLKPQEKKSLSYVYSIRYPEKLEIRY